LDKLSDEDIVIGVLEQLQHAWPDPVNLATKDVKLLIQSMMPLVYQEDKVSQA